MEEHAEVKTGRYGVMLSVISLLTGAAAFAILFFPENAWAWGAGIHIAQAGFILGNPQMLNPEIAAILVAHPYDYYYGCISADIFIGKGYKRRDDHCHNWDVGFKVLSEASDDSTKAYAYGYLTHLAADIVAHNYFIPNLLYSTPASKGLGHVYWEFRADRFIKKKHWSMASQVVSMHNHGNDTLIKAVMNRSSFRFGAKKMVFKRAVKMSDVIEWKEHVEGAGNGDRALTRRQVARLNNYSLNLIVDLLRNGEKAVCLNYDPVGTDNTIDSKLIRRTHLFKRKIDKNCDLFLIPEEILNVKYIDHDTERL